MCAAFITQSAKVREAAEAVKAESVPTNGTAENDWRIKELVKPTALNTTEKCSRLLVMQQKILKLISYQD